MEGYQKLRSDGRKMAVKNGARSMGIHGFRVAVFIDWLQTAGSEKVRLSMKGTKVSPMLKILKEEVQVSEYWLCYVKGCKRHIRLVLSTHSAILGEHGTLNVKNIEHLISLCSADMPHDLYGCQMLVLENCKDLFIDTICAP